jgi:DnaJ-class molecular chaperone
VVDKNKKKMTQPQKTFPCPSCGGCGQISLFKGESRFLLTDEECPACCGLGYLLDEDVDTGIPGSTED